MSEHATSKLFRQRLSHCCDLAGGKRALAQKAGISEGHLYRFLSGESDVPLGKAIAIAEAVDLPVSWLFATDEQLLAHRNQKLLKLDKDIQMLKSAIAQIESTLKDLALG